MPLRSLPLHQHQNHRNAGIALTRLRAPILGKWTGRTAVGISRGIGFHSICTSSRCLFMHSSYSS